MLRLGVDDVRETAVAMSTEAGVTAGRRAGAGVVAGVLTGTVPDGRLSPGRRRPRSRQRG